MHDKFAIAKQYINEKLNTTKREIIYEDDFIKLKKKFEAMAKFIEVFPAKINEIVHPDKQWRISHKLQDQFGKITKTPKDNKYPQVEKAVSLISLQLGSQVGGLYGQSLIDLSSGFDQISEMKDKLELDLNDFSARNQDINDQIALISNSKKKLSAKRLKLEALKNKKYANPDELYKIAEEYNTANLECYNAYLKFVEIEQDSKIEQMVQLAQSFEQFYSNCHKAMQEMSKSLQQRYKASLSLEKPNLKSEAELKFGQKVKTLIERCQTARHQSLYSPKQQLSQEPLNEQNSAIIYENMNVIKDLNSNNTKNAQILPIEITSQQRKLKSNSGMNHSNSINSFEDDEFADKVPAHIEHGKKPIMFRAIFNFQAEIEEELNFKIGDVISYISDLDENWYFGEFNNKKGIFPKEYVKRI